MSRCSDKFSCVAKVWSCRCETFVHLTFEFVVQRLQRDRIVRQCLLRVPSLSDVGKQYGDFLLLRLTYEKGIDVEPPLRAPRNLI